jgi:hypothetical protein
MESKMGLFSRRAFSNASSPHGYHSTGLPACWWIYGLVSKARRFLTGVGKAMHVCCSFGGMFGFSAAGDEHCGPGEEAD